MAINRDLTAPWLPAHGSSMIAYYRWQRDEDSPHLLTAPGTLEVEFRDGSIYRYYPTPEHVYADLFEAPSRGKAFWALVRRAGIPFEPVRRRVS